MHYRSILAKAVLLVICNCFAQQTSPALFTRAQDVELNITSEDPFNSVPYPPEESNEPRCQEMNIEFCHNIGYNRTMLPNIMNHNTQTEVITEINVFDPLLRLNCSPDIRLFLCAVYAPPCFEQDVEPISLPPCRSLCESARQGCSIHLSPFSQPWPEKLRCERFPDGRKADQMCVGKDTGAEYSNTAQTVTRDLGFVCPKNFQYDSYTLHLNGKAYKNCSLPCEGVLLSKFHTPVVQVVTFILAIISIVSTLYTCSRYLSDTSKFEYPSQPIIIISFCQFAVALCFILGFLTDNKVACNDPLEPPSDLPNLKMIRAITTGNKKGFCTLQFMALYFFQMSAVLWWLMMTISWYMIAGLKWAPEAVGSTARYFHTFSWTMAALLTIYLSVSGKIEGDPLSGVCYVSTSTEETIRDFVIYPISICLLIGCVFFLLGFKSLRDSRETLKRVYGKQTNEHQNLINRIGLYSILFITFSCILLYCHYYEQKNRDSWMLAWLAKICKNREFSLPCPSKNIGYQSPQPSTFILKYLATMAIGIISALFILSEKGLRLQ